ncbi:MAG TPA: hypothetical protein PKY96_17865, partial [Flavobacteriales bacterium]|nr:hypothetical protein [Flavobacteriales bacterium]
RIYEDGLSADERDIAQLDVKHAREREKLLANKLATEADLLALEEVQARERAELIEGQGEERVKGYSDAAGKIRRAMLSSAEREIDDEISKWDTLIALAQKYGIDAAALEEAKEEALSAVRKRYRDKEITDDAAASKAQLQARIGLYQGIGQAAAGLNSFLSAIYSDAQGRAFEDTEWGKTLALVQIATNAAVAVSQAVASSTAGDPYSLAARVAVAVGAVLGAIGQAYSVLNKAPATPPPPSSSGGAAGSASNIALGEKGLVLDGPSHAEDGLKVVNPKTGKVTAELEGGELVLSKLFTRNNRALVPMLLQMSAKGSRIPIGRSGGIFGRVAPFNFGAATEAVQQDASRFVRGVAMVNMPQGGNGTNAMFRKGYGGLAPAESGGMAETNALLRALLAASSRPTRAVVSNKEIDRRKSELTYLEDQGRVRRLK